MVLEKKMVLVIIFNNLKMTNFTDKPVIQGFVLIIITKKLHLKRQILPDKKLKFFYDSIFSSSDHLGWKFVGYL